MQVAFDIDNTIWEVKQNPFRQVPDYELIAVLRWFAKNNDEVFVWSAGGVDYAQQIVDKLGLDEIVKVVPKGSIRVDIAFDDVDTDLATVDVRVQRDREEL